MKYIRTGVFALYVMTCLLMVLNFIVGTFRCVNALIANQEPGGFEIVCLGATLLVCGVVGGIIWWQNAED